MAGETVLIVEDRRENIVHLANHVLKPNGYEVITAMDGRRGLKRIEADRPDLVILDLNMPRMDGLEVLAALRERGIRIPVILTTFYGSEQVAQQALRLGAVDYVVKPFQVDDMLDAVRKALILRPARPEPAQPARDVDEVLLPLTRQVERWMRDMNILNRVGKALVAQLDTERVYTRAVEAAIYVTRADYGLLFLKDETEAEKLCLCSMRGPQDRRAHSEDCEVESGLVFDVARSGEALLLASPPGDVALFKITGEALGPVAAVPLTWRRKTIGVLLAARSRGEAPFGDPDLEWLSGLAEYTAIASQNARAFESKAKETGPSLHDEQTLASLHQAFTGLQVQLAAAATSAGQIDELLASLGIEEPGSPPT
jgi:two-component system NtrC family sensor kinase